MRSCRRCCDMTVTLQKGITSCLLPVLSSLQLSHSPEVRPAIVVQLGLSTRGQLQVTHLTQRVRPALTWKEKQGREEKTTSFALSCRGILCCWSLNMSVTWGCGVRDRETDGRRYGRVHQLLTHPSKAKDVPTLQELRGAERSLHPCRTEERETQITITVLSFYSTWNY